MFCRTIITSYYSNAYKIFVVLPYLLYFSYFYVRKGREMYPLAVIFSIGCQLHTGRVFAYISMIH